MNVTVLVGAFETELCGADTGKMVGGVDVIGTNPMLLGAGIFSGSFEASCVSLIGDFISIGLVLIASVGAFKREVVVAVLNVTEVLVDKLADGDDDTITFGSSFSLDFLSSTTLPL